MANRANILRSILITLVFSTIVACSVPIQGADPLRPTVRPLIRVTPAIVQDVKGTATAFALQIVPTPTPVGQYIVKPGDSLGKIADEHQTTIDELMALNNISDPNLIEVGQTLRIPSLIPATTTADESTGATTAPETINTAAPEQSASAAPDATTTP